MRMASWTTMNATLELSRTDTRPAGIAAQVNPNSTISLCQAPCTACYTHGKQHKGPFYGHGTNHVKSTVMFHATLLTVSTVKCRYSSCPHDFSQAILSNAIQEWSTLRCNPWTLQDPISSYNKAGILLVYLCKNEGVAATSRLQCSLSY